MHLPHQHLFTTIMTKKITVAVILGSPAANCARYGVCSIEDDLTSQQLRVFIQTDHRHVVGSVWTTAQNTVAFSFPTAEMSELTLKMFFSGTHFLMEAPKTLSDKLCAALQLPQGSTLAAGQHLIDRSESERIIFEAPCEVEKECAKAHTQSRI